MAMAGQMDEMLFVLDPDLDPGILKEIRVVTGTPGKPKIATTRERWQNYAEEHGLLAGSKINPDQS